VTPHQLASADHSVISLLQSLVQAIFMIAIVGNREHFSTPELVPQNGVVEK
jgi:hypothetical protein